MGEKDEIKKLYLTSEHHILSFRKEKHYKIPKSIAISLRLKNNNKGVTQ